MKAFVSWSGERSKIVANELKVWLTDVFPNLEAWMSAHDIHAGSPWANELHRQLRDSNFGILCLTRENLNAPWLLYEAGALITSVKPGHVVPYLIGVEPAEIPLPLAQLQGVAADREGTFRLLQCINEAGESRLSDERLSKIFDKWWPDLAKQLAIPVVVRIEEGVAIVTPQSCIINEDDVKAFKNFIASLIDQGHVRIVIDCSIMSLNNSGVLGALLASARRSRLSNGDVILAGVSPSGLDTLKITRFDKILVCFKEVDEAVASFRERRSL